MEKTQYRAVYGCGKSAETGAFDPDDAEFYTAGAGAFDASVISGKVVNTLRSAVLFDRRGNRIEADETMCELMQAAAEQIGHDIWQLEIIATDTRTFAFVKWNVNWQSPCVLYEYHAASGLRELCRWDGVELLGISLP